MKEKLIQLNIRDMERLSNLKRKKENLEREISNLENKIANREFQIENSKQTTILKGKYKTMQSERDSYLRLRNRGFQS